MDAGSRMNRTILLVSTTLAEAQRLAVDGPRRDFLELARSAGAEIQHQSARRRNGIAGKLSGPHFGQAWRAAAACHAGDALFADGEHIGLPLQLFLALRRRRPGRLVVLGHLLTRPRKLALLWLATRVGPPGTLVLHSVEQERTVRRFVGWRWRISLAPYQVDTAYWTPGAGLHGTGALPLVLAVGSENRDYATLVRAVEGLPVRVIIAAGSHWARETAQAGSARNVEYSGRPLPFAELRERYREAAVVVVPVHDVRSEERRVGKECA